jgi:hypothetical protein
MVLFAGLVLLPLAYGRPGSGRPWPERGRLFGAGALAVVLVVAPWAGFNLSRFSHPVLISDRFGATLAAANCPEAWNGWLDGYWLKSCAMSGEAGARGDESALDAAARRSGLKYIGGHLAELPRVEGQRLGRTFAFWRVGQQLRLDAFIDGRPRPWVAVGLWSYYGLLLLAPVGLVRLRREGVPLFPLSAVLADVVVVVLVTYGQTRFRATLEPVLVLLAAAALSWAVAARPDRSRAPGQDPHRLDRGAVPCQPGGPVPGGPLHAAPEQRVGEEGADALLHVRSGLGEEPGDAVVDGVGMAGDRAHDGGGPTRRGLGDR